MTNHYQYLQLLSQQNDYLKINSFGLYFKREDNTSNLMFFKELSSDGTIIIENHRTLSKSSISSIGFYLPKQISEEQSSILDLFS